MACTKRLVGKSGICLKSKEQMTPSVCNCCPIISLENFRQCQSMLKTLLVALEGESTRELKMIVRTFAGASADH